MGENESVNTVFTKVKVPAVLFTVTPVHPGGTRLLQPKPPVCPATLAYEKATDATVPVTVSKLNKMPCACVSRETVSQDTVTIVPKTMNLVSSGSATNVPPKLAGVPDTISVPPPPPAATIVVRLNSCCADCCGVPLSCTRIVKVLVPGVVGVPLILPVD